jgi:hypothetical protein
LVQGPGSWISVTNERAAASLYGSSQMNGLQRAVGTYFLLSNLGGVDVLVPRAPLQLGPASSR